VAVHYLSFSSSALPAILIHLDFVRVFLSVEKHCIVFYFQTLECKESPIAALFQWIKFTLCPIQQPWLSHAYVTVVREKQNHQSFYQRCGRSDKMERFVWHDKRRARGMAEHLFLSTRETLCFVRKFFAVQTVSV